MKKSDSHNKLLAWYETEGRHDLPWRNTDDIYHIYLSEVMLQQTQVSRVMEEYYPKFLEKFPTLEDLAAAELDEVLATWSGLGYYSRARNLHQAAKEAGKELPQDLKSLLKLPGIGHYTASAVCSFGYEQKVPVVDTNIARVIKRFFALKNANEKQVLEKAEGFLNDKDPKHHNLALMDLGAMVCLPKNPKCELCPLSENCKGKENPEIYTQTKKTQYEALDLFYGVLIKDGRIALIPSTGKMYRNMLELPTVEPIEEDLIGTFKHSYTKYRLTVHLYKIEDLSGEIIWQDLDKLNEAPISSLVKKAEKLFDESIKNG